MIYHLTRTENWDLANPPESYTPDYYESEGFIHFSTGRQLIGSATKHFKEDSRLLVLVVNDKVLSNDDLKWEPGRENQLFPHLYRPLKGSEVVATSYLERDAEGNWVPVF